MRATKIGGETALGRSSGSSAYAQASKPPVQRLADRISAVFVPGASSRLTVATRGGWLAAGGASGPRFARAVAAC